MPIIPYKLPFDPDDKIFQCTDYKGNIIGQNYSYNEWENQIRSMGGFSEELMGKNDKKSSKECCQHEK